MSNKFISKSSFLVLALLMSFSVSSVVMAGGSPRPPSEPTEPSNPTQPSDPIGEEWTFRSPASSAPVLYMKNGAYIKKESDLKDLASKLKGSKYSYNSKTKVYTWDLKGGILDGKNQTGKCDQSENQEPLFRAQMSLVIKNGFIRNAKNAASFYKPDSGVERVTWLNVCEDAVATSKGAYNFTIRDSQAKNSSKGDKSFQFNEARGLVVEDNLISGGITGMRIGDSNTTQVSQKAYMSGNRFMNVDTAHNLSKITVVETGPSYYKNVRLQWKHSNGSKKEKGY